MANNIKRTICNKCQVVLCQIKRVGKIKRIGVINTYGKVDSIIWAKNTLENTDFDEEGYD